ncbi:hypothetical protein D9611_004747 [Ephemerocybe angulata]|uniref:Methyltransferase domain-containing protein n=1 Tax=Ephemerocybe angulata TaxID=980116 RepID=A0A8H5B365_9AGAR|nr:hypothetical protein D9611_004747 [Tulosesus angulatus]
MLNDSAGDPDLLLSAGDQADQFFRSENGRLMAAMSDTYPLPVDKDEHKRSELHHRLLQFVFSGKNYLGPVKEALQFGQKRRILDLGTGKGHWAIEMADEFPRADVIGIDIAPIQPAFEICNLDEDLVLPYLDGTFDFIHARSLHIGIQDYPRLLQEIGRLLRPGGLVLLVEPDLFPVAERDQSTGPIKTTNSMADSSDEPRSMGDLYGQPNSAVDAGQGDAGVVRNVNIGSANEQELGDTHRRALLVDESPSTMHTPSPPQIQSPNLPACRGSTEANPAKNISAKSALTEAIDAEGSVGPMGSPFRSLKSLGKQRESPDIRQRSSHVPSTAGSPSNSSVTTSPPRGPTMNRRHLDFILNHPPESPEPSDVSTTPPPEGDPISNAPTSHGASNSNPDGAEVPDDSSAQYNDMLGWSTLWSTFRTCLQDRECSVDVDVPSRLGVLLAKTEMFEDITVKQANVPVGFWPGDPTLLTIGQLQWMDYELLIPALLNLFVSQGIPQEEVDVIIGQAQHDLYYPTVPLMAHIHIAYASKRPN